MNPATSASALARPEILQLAGYSSARMEASASGVRLDANESPWPGAGPQALNRYPEPQPPALRAALARLYGVEESGVLLTRGSDEAIDLLVRAFCCAGRDAIVVAPPTFGMYAVCAAVQGARVLAVPRLAACAFACDPRELADAAIASGARLVFACNPNNPTGDAIEPARLLQLARALAGRALLVVDEAYIEFADVDSLAGALEHQPNLVLLRTLSKAHALAAARVGALLAAADVVALLRRIMAPYPLPAPSVELALQALQPAALAATRARICVLRAERARVVAALAALRGVQRVLPSHGNFVAFAVVDAPGTHARLAAGGVLVRDVSRLPGMDGFLRAAIGTPRENDALLELLERAA